jgi:hypothetical protein
MTTIRVVTFSCSNDVHVYTEKSYMKPRYPYLTHSSIDDAMKYLKDRNIKEPKILEK